MSLKKILRIIFDETSSPITSPTEENSSARRRYVARVIPGRSIGGYGWEVFDRKEQKQVKDRDLRQFSEDKARETFVS